MIIVCTLHSYARVLDDPKIPLVICFMSDDSIKYLCCQPNVHVASLVDGDLWDTRCYYSQQANNFTL